MELFNNKKKKIGDSFNNFELLSPFPTNKFWI